MKKKFKTIDEYVTAFPPKTRKILNNIRKTIRAAEPKLTEGISYGIPTFYLNGRYVMYFAGFEKHVSVYPIIGGEKKKFAQELKPYLSGKGTAKFMLDKPIPYGLIKKLVKFRVKERLASEA